MRFIVILAAVIGGLEVAAFGDNAVFNPQQFDWGTKKRSIRRRNEGNLDFGDDPSGAKYVTTMLTVVFEMPEWRDLMLMFATKEELDNGNFRARWNITDNDIVNSNLSPEEPVRDKLRKLLRSGKWRGLIALSSTKDDLIDVRYRQKWGLGQLRNDVRYSSVNGNFFDGPQWKEFLSVTSTTRSFMSAQERARWLRKWLLNAMELMMTL